MYYADVHLNFHWRKRWFHLNLCLPGGSENSSTRMIQITWKILNVSKWISTNINVYKAMVHTCHFCWCETWILYRRYVQKKGKFPILSLHWSLTLIYVAGSLHLETWDRANSSSTVLMVIRSQVWRTVQAVYMEQYRIRKHLLYKEMVCGQQRNRTKMNTKLTSPCAISYQWI